LDGLHPLDVAAGADSFILDVPYRSQFDASPYQNANCGPAALAMVLEAYGLDVPNERLRAIADQLQGTSGYSDGVALEYLEAIARQAGLRAEGLKGSDGRYRQWTMADVIREIRRGYPVITLVHYSSLPAHAGSTSVSDHYVVVVGLTASGFVINDPASTDSSGFHQLLTPQQLLEAWRTASVVQEADAFLPPSGTGGLRQLTFALAATSTPTMQAAAPSVLPSSSLPQPPSPSLVEPPLSTVTPADASTPEPSWVLRASSWQHAAPMPTIARARPPAGASPTTLVLAERQSADSPLSLTGLVVIVVGLLAMAILKSPSGDHTDRDLIRRDW
jgi:hypothetical protein